MFGEMFGNSEFFIFIEVIDCVMNVYLKVGDNDLMFFDIFLG